MGLLIGLDFIARLGLWLTSSLSDKYYIDWIGNNLPILLPSSGINCWMMWEDAWSASTLFVALGYAIALWGYVYNKWQNMVL